MLAAIPDMDRRLSYGSLKCVLQKFKANFRFRLAERLPEIRCAEKAVPLYIDKFTFAEEGFKLNNTEYQLGVICQVRDGPAQKTFIGQAQYGGHPRDIDRFGYEIRSFTELTPGDIFVQDYNPQMDADDDLEFETTEESLLIQQNRLIALEKEKIELEHAPEEVENIPENPMELDLSEEDLIGIEPEEEDDLMDPDQVERGRDQVLSRKEQLEKINISIIYAKTLLAYIEFDLERNRRKRDNLPSLFDFFIQFTKTSPDGTVYIERFNYDKSLMAARKYLICKLLGNRKPVMKIKSLGFWARPGGGLVISLPEGIKLDVQNFGTSGNLSDVLERVEPVLEYPNRPFNLLTSDSLRLEDAQNPKVQNAEVLVLSDNWDVDYIALCREVQNKNIVIFLGQEMQPLEYGLLVEDLIETKGTVGTFYEITQTGEDKTKEAMRFIAAHFENVVMRESLIIIPLSHQLQLNVSCEPYLMDPSLVHLWTMKMEVVQNQKN
ncbi:Protein CBG00129 [Caenorhabditis briggsae]|uniref:Protein CBG00129 n=1 Tax=Caenorhabditis briggsae TaxID=6238 RepID=A8WMC6_CAEBR|nr:Protein CBG00129 [Caenorhabditis briggsae]CAP21630.2 Protein CBG00129 [Caenorhabditis briggsae]